MAAAFRPARSKAGGARPGAACGGRSPGTAAPTGGAAVGRGRRAQVSGWQSPGGARPAAGGSSPRGSGLREGFGVGFRWVLGVLREPRAVPVGLGSGGLRGAGKGSGLQHEERSAPASQRQAAVVAFHLFIYLSIYLFI